MKVRPARAVEYGMWAIAIASLLTFAAAAVHYGHDSWISECLR